MFMPNTAQRGLVGNALDELIGDEQQHQQQQQNG